MEHLLSKNREVTLNRAKDYYENSKELLRGRAKNKYRELSEEEKNIKRQYGKNRYHNMSQEKKKKTKRISTYNKETYFTDADMPMKVHFKIDIANMFVLLLTFKR